MAPQKQPTLVELAERMLEYAKNIEAAVGSPDDQNDTILDLPKDLKKIRLEAIATSDKFNDLVRGSRGQDSRHWKTLHGGWLGQMCWDFIYRFKVPQAVPLDSKISYADLSKATGAHESDLRQVLRCAMSLNLFCSPEPDYVAHTIDTRQLRQHPTMLDWIGYCSVQCSASYTKLSESCAKFPGSGEANESAYSLFHQTSKPMYEHMYEHPDWHRRFGGAMEEFSLGDTEQVGATALAYPWTGNEKVVDIGGGSGHISILLANKYPNMSFIVQDLPNSNDASQASLPPHLHSRIKFVAHDFFTPQPPTTEPADVYFLASILHNHSDKYAIQILQNLIPGLKPGARILWCDRDVGSGLAQSQKTTLQLDMIMKMLFNAKERTLQEKIDIFERADKRFRYERQVVLDEGHSYTITEAVWSP